VEPDQVVQAFLKMAKRGLTLFELLVSVCVIFALVGLFAIYANNTVKVSREIALQSELKNIRMSIQHFYILNGRYPNDLFELRQEPLTTGSDNSKIILQSYLGSFRVDKEGCLLDPFFNRYVYNKVDGSVHPGSNDYQRW